MLHQTSNRWRFGLALSLATVFLWGILPVALAVILQKLDAYTLSWFIFVLSFILLANYLAIKGKLPQPNQLRGTSLTLLAIASIFLGGSTWLFNQSIALTSPTSAQIIIQSSNLFLAVGGLIIFKERFETSQWLGAVVLTSGFGVFFLPQLTNQNLFGEEYLYGNILVLLAAIFWTVYALAQKQLLQSLSSSNIMLLIYLGCILIFTPLSQIEKIFTLDIFDTSVLLFCGLNSLLSFTTFAESLEHWDASRVSAILALSPIVTLLSIWLISGIAPDLIPLENLQLTNIVGGLFIVIGSVVIAYGGRSATSP